MNTLLQRLVEQGMIKYFNLRTMRVLGVREEQDITTNANQLNISSITLVELEFILAIVFVGILTSIIVFFIEVVRGHWQGICYCIP